MSAQGRRLAQQRLYGIHRCRTRDRLAPRGLQVRPVWPVLARLYDVWMDGEDDLRSTFAVFQDIIRSANEITINAGAECACGQEVEIEDAQLDWPVDGCSCDAKGPLKCRVHAWWYAQAVPHVV